MNAIGHRPTETTAQPVIQLRELLGALSHALDLTEGQPEGHCIRCCWIGLQIAEKMQMDDRAQAELYYTILLKDLGCSSNAARICQLYLTDDLDFKKGFKNIDGSITQALRFVIRHSGTNSNLAEKFKNVFHVLVNNQEIAHEIFETRCHQGAEIAAMMRFPASVSDGIQALDEHWNGGGRPYRLAGDDIPLFSRIALLSQVVDVFFQQGGSQAALAEATGRAGSWFDPAVVAAFEDCAAAPGFWDTLAAPDIHTAVFASIHAQTTNAVDDVYLDEISHAFARVIDAKSPFTGGHSERVALYTDMICGELQFDDRHRQWMRRTALLHDLGKLGVSNTILDKPGKLTDEEFAIMRLHPEMGRAVLSQISIFRELSEVAAAHHERLDGKGYPYGMQASDLSLDMRILAVADVFDALTADRPYRAALPLEKTYAIMDDMVDCAIDRDCYEALKQAVLLADHLDLS